MTKEILNNKLANEQLNQVNGGTFDSNKHDERIYNQAGMRTDYGFFAKDKFFIKNKDGKEISITYAQANWAVEYWQKNNKQATYEIVAANCKK